MTTIVMDPKMTNERRQRHRQSLITAAFIPVPRDNRQSRPCRIVMILPTMLLFIVWSCSCISCGSANRRFADAFSTHIPPLTRRWTPTSNRAMEFIPKTSTTTLKVIMADPHADMEFKEKHEKKDRNDNGDENDWTEVPGGFVPHISSAPETTRGKSVTIPVVTTLADYKRVVVDEPNRITVVRFAAPWCRACKAVQPHFAKLALHYQQLQQQQSSTATTSSEKSDTMMVQFVECPVSKDTALLHQGLGVPSVPFGHIYHPTAGLVEEIKLNKKVFGTFCRVLETYVQGYCDVTYINDNHDHDGTAAAAGTTGSAELRVAPSPSRSQPDDEGFL